MDDAGRLALAVLGGLALSAAACSTSPRPPNAVAAAHPIDTAPRQRAHPDQLYAAEVTSHRGMVVTGNASASWAGARVLEAGGNAIDAAVAAAFALGVAEPGSSGIGGQTFILVRLADGRAVAIDGSAHAPLWTVREELAVLREAQLRIRLDTAFSGHKAVATPGTLAALDLALRSFGTKTLGEVVEPAIAIAELGSVWTPAHRSFLVDYPTRTQASTYLSRLFLKDGVEVWDQGHVYCNPDLACFLRRLVAVGVNDFYRGAIAAEIEKDMIANGGWVRRADLGVMEAKIKEPARGRYRGLEVLSFPYPAGGSTVVEALGILGCFDPRLLREDSVDRLHLLVEACRLAYADSFPARRPARLPDELAADGRHLASRAALIRFDRALRPSEVSATPLSEIDASGTTQVSTADAYGNVVSLTQTIGATFGSGAATAGFGFAYNGLLNGYDYLDPRAWSYLSPLQPPMNCMAPTIVVSGGRPLLVLGSAGSARIGPAIVNAISDFVDRGLPLCEAIATPRALWGGGIDGDVYLEIVDPITEEQADALAARGFARQERLVCPATPYELTHYGSVNAIFVDPRDGTMVGVGDPRRQGVARAASPALPAAQPLVLPECWRELR